MKFQLTEVSSDLVIVGAGTPGISAAIQAAREGLNVVLINDRGCVGGNCGMEIFVTCNGANDGNSFNINLREGGIIDEMRAEYKYRSVLPDRFALDGVYMDALEKANVHLYLNTCIDEAETDKNGRILSVSGTQNTTETRFTFRAPLFIDDTGDGTLGALAGAEYMLGRESKDTFSERIAPDEADSFVIPSTLTFTAHDTGSPRPYVAPDFAIDIEKSGALAYRTIPHDKFYSYQWFYEGDGALDQVKERETIIRDHRKLVYGIWNYIKNSGKYPEAENYALSYVSVIPGMREYRRLKGDFIMTEKDLVGQREYEDAVGHGGWNIDLHAIHGFFDDDLVNRHIGFRGAYQIPYRAGYSKNVENLFMCGRCMSTSHVAFGSTRVAATLSTLGQAVGMAAAICKENGILPRGVYEHHAKELQQRLLREDQLIPGVKNCDPRDKALKAKVTASSEAMLEIREKEKLLPIGEGIALMLPLVTKADMIELYAACETDASLTYNIYKPLRPYNFGPDTLVKTGKIALTGSTEPTPVQIPLDGLAPESYYFIEVLSEEKVLFSAASAPMLNTVQYRRGKNKSATTWNYDALGMNDYNYWRETDCASYRILPAQRAYAPENAVNGYNRACGGTNVWLSDKGDNAPSLTLMWDEAVMLSMVQITFGIDTSSIIEHYPKQVFDNIAREYRVYGLLRGSETLLAHVKNNHAKRNRLTFPRGLYDAIRFDFDECEGGQAAVYEVRAEE